MKSNQKSFTTTFAIYSGLGAQLVVSVLLLGYGGYYLDQKWQSEPFLTILGLFSGAGIGFWQFFRVISKTGNSNNE